MVWTFHGCWRDQVSCILLFSNEFELSPLRRSLCEQFEPANLGVVSSMDGAVYKTEVVEASHHWTRPVLILLNLRLGLDRFNTIYLASVKSIFTFPQAVGIAGGRPSSSYYFVGCQENSLFYIDPHFPRPAVVPSLPTDEATVNLALNAPLTAQSFTSEKRRDSEEWLEVQEQADVSQKDIEVEGWAEVHAPERPVRVRTPRPSARSIPTARPSDQSVLDDFFASAYSPNELLSFHPERVRKMAAEGLDPSMLVGFLIQSEEEYDDWHVRSSALKPALYSTAAEPPNWAKQYSTSRRSSIAASSSPPIQRKASASQPPVDQPVGEHHELSGEDDWDMTDSEDGSFEERDKDLSMDTKGDEDDF